MNCNPKTKAPKINVFKGVREFKIELTELSISVWAIANKYAGINVPNREVKAMYFHLYIGILDKLLNPINNKKTAAKIIRNDPNCKAVKPINPFFISINELPQTKARTIK